ncbi:MAG: copper chaperone PCu(A)C [Gammaproteobacteria bacterium]|nr:copper chaperone PCu(A)C [Gammaproteobacteria bacterium]
MFSRRLMWSLGALALSSVIAAAGPVAAARQVAAADATVENGWLRQLLPGQNRTAGYFDIINHGSASMTLVGASSDAAGAIEFHRSINDGNLVRMQRVEKVVVGPGETVRFQPGGLHLMLFRVADLAAQTKVQLLTDTGIRIDAVFRKVPVGVD